jgi:putative inorganic carbon (hco3(-)) transporter
MTLTGTRSWVALSYLALVVLLGGASAAGFSANALLQFGGAFLISWTLWSERIDEGLGTGTRIFFVALAVLALLQFVPLPPGLWENLPGRKAVADGFTLAGFSLPWLSFSLDPWASLQSLVWWFPPLAVFVAMRSMQGPKSRHVILALQIIAYAMVVVAAIQASTGAAYIYASTNFGNGVGQFANSNHFGSFLLVTIALVAGQWIHDRDPSPRIKPRFSPGLVLIAQLSPLIFGVFLSQSMACMMLLVPMLLGIALIYSPKITIRWPIVFLAGVLIVIGMVWLLTSGVLANDLTAKSGTAGISRGEFLATGLKILGDFSPFGSGIGTFRDLYAWYEEAGMVGTTFVNHAHNDLLELAIETGAAGLIVLVTFVWWFGRRAITIWNADRGGNPVALSATLGIAAVLTHSLVDYPLRTAAVSSLIALCMVIMCRSAEPTGAAAQSPRGTGKREDMMQI